MRTRIYLSVIALACLLAHAATAAIPAPTTGGDALAAGFDSPPLPARLRAYWWWLNGNVTKDAITKDLEWMQQIGMGGGLVFDAGGATQGGHEPVPAGPLFGTPEWRDLFKHAVREADRLGLEISLNLTSGWNLGGPVVTPERGAKLMTWTEILVAGPTNLSVSLPAPKIRENFYRDAYVLAFQQRPQIQGGKRKPIRQLAQKSAVQELGGSAADCSPLLEDDPSTPGEEDTTAADVQDLTSKLDSKGVLDWEVPVGKWSVIRFGYTYNGAKVSTSSGKWQGLVLDYLDADAFRWYWNTVIDPIIDDIGPSARKAWKFVQTDSWELGGVNWSAKFPVEFKTRRGYDLRPWLPVLAGKVVNSRDASNKFLADFRRTIADCIADNHYGTMASLAHKHGMGIQPESAGPHVAPLDGLKCYGRSDWPMSEFWVPSPHRPTPPARFFVKQAASAAHIYGLPIVCAEGFTSIGPQWNDVLWSSQKPSFDHEACAGLNLVFWHAFTCSPKEMGLPGQEYFAGTHFNPQITWAKQAGAFVSYLNRCQFILQQGRFVADVLYYYGNHVPNIARLKNDDPAHILPDYDYDVINEEVLLRLDVNDDLLVLPSGMSYRVLALPNLKVMSLEVARKLHQLVGGGAVVVGPKPERTTGQQDDSELRRIAEELWDGNRIKTLSAKETLKGLGVLPDVEGIPDWIHRRDGDADIYFICNQTPQAFNGICTFRVSGKQPEFWDAVSGARRDAAAFIQTGSRTSIPIELPPYGSLFVVFRKPASANGNGRNYETYSQVASVTGPWTVSFDPKWGGPESVVFDNLINWTNRPEEGIRFYSGTATYRKTFDCQIEKGRIFLDLGEVMNLAEVRLNGKGLGVVWAPPFRVDITETVRPRGNALEIDVVNTWYNRLVKDLSMPAAQRLTRTNIRLKAGAEPVSSGLLGPVTLWSSSP